MAGGRSFDCRWSSQTYQRRVLSCHTMPLFTNVLYLYILVRVAPIFVLCALVPRPIYLHVVPGCCSSDGHSCIALWEYDWWGFCARRFGFGRVTLHAACVVTYRERYLCTLAGEELDSSDSLPQSLKPA